MRLVYLRLGFALLVAIVFALGAATVKAQDLNTLLTTFLVNWRAGTIVFTPLATAPSGAVSGQMYMDSTPNPDELCVFDGTGWQALITGTDANCA